MYERLGALVTRHWLLVIVGWIGLLVFIRGVAPAWDDVTQDGDLAYLPSQMSSVQGERLLATAFPEGKAKSQIVLVCERPEAPLTSDDLRTVDRLAARFTPNAPADLPIIGVWTPWSEVIGAKLISRDRRAALVVLLLNKEFMAVRNIEALRSVLTVMHEARDDVAFPPGLKLGVTGSAAIGGDMLSSAQESIHNTELATVLLVVLILLLVYRAPVVVLIPLITITVAVAVSMGLVSLLTQVHLLPGFSGFDFKVFKTTKIFIVVILFGSGTDFCLFLISRYKEGLEHGLTRPRAVRASLGQVGEALVGSALTTILGLGTMFFADFGKYRSSGPAIALCLAVTLAACLTLAPALLRLFGGALFWPFGGDHKARAAHGRASAMSRLWEWASRVIVARPGAILVASVLLMAPLAWKGWSVEISYDLLSELQDDRPSVQGTRLLRSHFFAGDTGPVTVLAERRGAEFHSRTGQQEIARLTKRLYDLPGVSSVRSSAEPLGDKPGYFNPFSPAGRRKLAAKEHPETKAIYLSQGAGQEGDVTRLDVILNCDPFSRQAVEELDRLDSLLKRISVEPGSAWKGTRFVYAGTTAAVRDLKAVTESDRVLIQRLVVIAVLAVLIVILRKPLICLYLIVSVLFTYLVTIGATEMAFAWMYESFDGLDWKVPIFLFVILTAVGEDYNIYLVTRVFEEQKRHGPMEGLRIATLKTGGIITSCGVIMAGTFLSMMVGTLRGMLELGFALSLGVMLDTMVVRPILAPAFLAIIYRRATEPVAVARPAAAAHEVVGVLPRR